MPRGKVLIQMIVSCSVIAYNENSIFYACNVEEGATADVPTTCTIQVTGVKYGTGITVVQELIYNPGLLPVGQTFNFTTFPTSFQGLVQTNIQIISGAVDTSLIDLTLDNHAYTAYLGS